MIRHRTTLNFKWLEYLHAFVLRLMAKGIGVGKMALRVFLARYLKLSFANWLVFFSVLIPNFSAAAGQPTLINTPIILDRGNQTFVEAKVQRPVDKRVGVVVMLQGSVCESEQDGFAALLEPWQQRYALLYVAKPGSSLAFEACDESYLRTNTIQQRVADLQLVIRELKKQRWWNRKLYLIGGSEGGLIAGLAATQIRETQRVAILSFGGGLTMSEMWPGIAYNGVLGESSSVALAQQERRNVLEGFAKARANPQSVEVFNGDSNTLKWWASILDIRLSDTLINFRRPILLMHGSEDQMAAVAGARSMVRTFADAGKKNLTYQEFAGYNHGFIDKEGKKHDEEVFDQALTWLLGPKD
jgi:dienelactone hydrolase